MSSISISGSDSSLAQFFQKLSSSSATSATTAAAPTASATPTVAATNADQTTNDSSAPARGAGAHHHGHGGLFKKVQAAVSSALEAAKSDPNADPNKVVEDAIAKVFKDNGGAPGAAAPGADASAGVNGSNGDGDHVGADGPSGDGDIAAARQAFTQTLSAFGISASQFHSDFLAAVQDAQGGGTPDSSGLFKNFPPGSNIDTTA
jgi:hypothetical protein